MEVPEVQKMFGIFPLNYATFLISVFSAGVGGIGLTGIILFGLVENRVVSNDISAVKADSPIKKASILIIGLSSLMLFIAGILLILGVTFNFRGCITIAAWVYVGMCIVIIIISVSAPLACFFLPASCLIKKISTATMVMGYLSIMFFLTIWLYCMVILFNYLNSM